MTDQLKPYDPLENANLDERLDESTVINISNREYNEQLAQPGREIDLVTGKKEAEEEKDSIVADLIYNNNNDRQESVKITDKQIKQKIQKDLFEVIKHFGDIATTTPIKVEEYLVNLRKTEKFQNNSVINNIDPKDLIKLTNAYIEMGDPKPENLNEFSQRSENMPGIRECLKKCIETISRLFKKEVVLSERAKIGRATAQILEDDQMKDSATKQIKSNRRQTMLI